MHLHTIDIAIIIAYLCSSVFIGYWVSHRASRDMKAYFLGGNAMPWYMLGISNASGMFDISGTMLLVYWMFIYGLKSVWIPWLWPTFNQIFLMVYLSTWLRRSNVMTGAEWIKTRFGTGTRRPTLAPDRCCLRVRQHHRLLQLRIQRHRQIRGNVPALASFAKPVCGDPDRDHGDLRDQGRHDQRRAHRSDPVLHSVDCVVCGGHHRHDESGARNAGALRPGWLGQHLLQVESRA